MNTEDLNPRRTSKSVKGPSPKVILVSVDKDDPGVPVVELMDELALLLDNLDLPVVRKVIQNRESEDPATFIGKGKAE